MTKILECMAHGVFCFCFFGGLRLGVQSVKVKRATAVLSIRSDINHQNNKLEAFHDHNLRYIVNTSA